MDIVRLIKISSQFPNTRLAKATRNYLLSLVGREIYHNSRINQLTDRVASTPSNHWQKGLMLLKMASQGDDVTHLLEHWEDHSSRSLAFEGDKREIIRLAYENPSLRPIVIKTAESAQVSQTELNQAGKQKKRHQNKAPKGEGKDAKRKTEKAKKKNKKQELSMLMQQYDSATSGSQRTRITKSLVKTIRGNKRTKSTPKLLKIKVRWNKLEKGLESVTNPNTKREVKWKTLFSNPNTKEIAEEIRKKEYIDPLFALARRIVQQEGGGSKDDSKKKDEPKKDDSSKSDTSKSDSGGEDKGIVESLMESEGISKEEAQEMAGNILGDEDEDDTTEAPDSSESATGQSVSTSGGLGGLGGGDSGGGESSGGSKGYARVTNKKPATKSKKKMQSQSRKKNRSKKKKNRGKKGSELELNTSTDLDIIF